MTRRSRNIRILLVEDDWAISTALNLRLSAEGFDVRVLEDGMDAVQQGKEIAPDLLLLDVNLPSADGFVVADSLRAALGGVPIIFMTALRDTHHVDVAQAMENTWYLEKPFTTPFLVHTVHTAAAS